ncbi:MAG TPA: hypothetical protein DEP43_05150 [Ruminococcaceae bacterium]|nr:hypothetical protein [Oscillospiraceae bacterium]
MQLLELQTKLYQMQTETEQAVRTAEEAIAIKDEIRDHINTIHLYASLSEEESHSASVKEKQMLLAYSLGLGIPFVFSAVLIDYLKSAFNWIKKNYKTINAVSGILLVLIGVLMATGTMGKLLGLLG